MPDMDIQKMFILDFDFKFGADKKVSAWKFLYFSGYHPAFRFCQIGKQTYNYESPQLFYALLGSSSLLLLRGSWIFYLIPK